MPVKHVLAALWLLAFQLLASEHCMAQDLEPRRWSHLPTGLNVVGVGVARTDGDIYFDPVLKVEDATFELNGLATSYVRSFDWLGKSSRFDVVLPYASGRWEGLLDGEYASRRRRMPERFYTYSSIQRPTTVPNG